MPVSVRDVVYEYAKDMKHLFGTDLSKVFIYGSYARGDYTENSDVDVMVLVKTPEKEIKNYTDRVSDLAFDYMMRYEVNISPIVKNEEHFNYWVDNLPYYRNVRNEGVLINAE